jgi:pyruvate,orthophosphate dikinase
MDGLPVTIRLLDPPLHEFLPDLTALSVKGAVAEATAALRAGGKDPRPEIMVPLVAAVQELQLVREQSETVVADVAREKGVELAIPIGTMIELPRAAMTAHEIAEAADFFSFGTNDLTQTAWGFSRDDVEASFFSRYMDEGVFSVSPFESLDVGGVGRLVSIAAWEGNETHPAIKVGVCGEHGGGPRAVRRVGSVRLA